MKRLADDFDSNGVLKLTVEIEVGLDEGRRVGDVVRAGVDNAKRRSRLLNRPINYGLTVYVPDISYRYRCSI